MRLTHATDYAVRSVLYLATLPKGTMVEAGEIAAAQCVPLRFLLKIFRSLASVGIVGSQRGPGGGYVLLRDPAEITLLNIFEAVEGPVAINHCLMDGDFCSRHAADYCPVRKALGSVQQVLADELSRYTIASLAADEKKPGLE
ncbi:MAG TPA: Rrf2 family transcriptional regulator [Spirochaetia bacterium]|nr:Rrf2 family transcriptional regulator [Spirochaetia bacterium]